jgi:hypothetical protein
MSTLQVSPDITTTALPPRRRPRVSLRLIVLLAVVSLPFLYFGYVILDQSLNGGVTKHANYYDVDLKSLGYFPFDPAKDDLSNVPARWRELDGKRVALVGEMYAPGEASDRIKGFELVYSIQKCCFNGPPRVQERVFAGVPNHGTVQYYPQVVRVVGTLHVNARRDEVGQISRVFELDVETVDPV